MEEQMRGSDFSETDSQKAVITRKSHLKSAFTA